MDTATCCGVKLSRMMLGTVQFGLDYGIANRAGKPSYELAREIIQLAVESGVNCLDTAAAYGDSEQVISRALSELNLRDKVTVISKVPKAPEARMSQAEAEVYVTESIEGSLQRLEMDILPLVLLHSESDLDYLETLGKCRDLGIVKHVGVSVESPAGAMRAVTSGIAEAVQIPLNVLDKRFLESGVLAEAKKRNVAIFTRSVYLQGLLLMPEADIHPDLKDVIPVRRQLEDIAKEHQMSMAELAMRSMLNCDGVTSVLVGVDSVEQLRENVAIFQRGALCEKVRTRIDKAVPLLPESILNPRFWPKRTS